jgi:hypothetical protein
MTKSRSDVIYWTCPAPACAQQNVTVGQVPDEVTGTALYRWCRGRNGCRGGQIFLAPKGATQDQYMDFAVSDWQALTRGNVPRTLDDEEVESLYQHAVASGDLYALGLAALTEMRTERLRARRRT